MGLKPITVAQLNNYIGRVLHTDPLLGSVSVIGEVSNLKFHGSGHIYFTLKDSSSKVNCFLASGVLPGITCPLEEGMEIVATGNISVYERGGYYSLSIRDIESNGTGQLAVLFEQLKKKLEKEGLFAENAKKSLPFFPEKIAVVTSETSAAVKDIVRTIKNKNDFVDILIYPVLVQGPGAPDDIADAIDNLNKNYNDIDVIITGRGGGSTEELWAFNEERVARSIFASHIPVISAVGHETDFTISDFVADMRAATPTAAAEMAVPNTSELKEYVRDLSEGLASDLTKILDIKRSRLEALNPETFALGIRNRIEYEQMNVDRLIEGMKETLLSKLQAAREKTEMLKTLVETANPKSILSRGYSVVTDDQGKIVLNAGLLLPGHNIHIEYAVGRAEATVTKINKEKNDERKDY